mgnify:CR=1 FL=1
MTLRPDASPCTIGDVCEFESGNGFRPQDWKTKGLPIIRIQNLNGSDSFNYFDGEPDPSWIVETNDLLFAWAGVKGVSFGPTIWNGPKGVLNQHIYRIRPKKGINKRWLYYALLEVTAEIEKKAHGFKTSLVHVRKADITRARVSLPSEHEQEAVATALGHWDTAIQKTEQLIAAKERHFAATSHLLLTSRKRLNGFSMKWGLRRADEIFENISRKGHLNEPLLSVTQERGVIPRDMLEGRVSMPSGERDAFKLVEPGNFVISLRSFQGGLEHSNYRGLVSPAYTVLRELVEIDERFFRHYFKSADFIKRLSVAVIGIRDGKQISFQDFCSIKLPFPPVDEQKAIALLLDEAEGEIGLLRDYTDALKAQKRGLMQKLLTGEWRLPVRKQKGA